MKLTLKQKRAGVVNVYEVKLTCARASSSQQMKPEAM
jgi:hypothetical protein